MKICVYSDPHLHRHNGKKEKYDDVKNNLYRMLEISRAKGCQMMFCLGDVFETQQKVESEALHDFGQFCQEVEKHMPQVIIVGNHDKPTKADDGITALTPFATSKTTIVSKVIQNESMVILPWSEDPQIPDLKGKIVFGHLAIKGAMMNSHVACEHGVEAKTLMGARIILLGHFHKRHGPYIGALTEQDWRGAGNGGGFGIYDTDTNMVEFVELPCIRHIVITDQAQINDSLAGHCVSISLNQPMSAADQSLFSDRFKEMGILDVRWSNIEATSASDMKNLESRVKTTKEYMAEKLALDGIDESRRGDFLDVGTRLLSA